VLRFQKQVKFLGLTLRFGKRGLASVSLGGRWVRLSINRQGLYLGGSLVGTGLSTRKQLVKFGNR
jgi:hypothetical protein